MALEVGTLLVRLEVESGEFTSGMASARSELEGLGKAAEDAGRRTSTSAKEAGEAGRNIGKDTATGAREASTSIKSTGEAAQQLRTQFREASQTGRTLGEATDAGAKRATTSIKSTGTAAQDLRSKFRESSQAGRQMGSETESGAKRATSAVKSTGSAAQDLRARFHEASQSGRNVEVSRQPRQELEGATGSARDFSVSLNNVKTIAATLGVAFGAQQAVQFFTGAINSAREAEAIMLRTTNTFGDAASGVEEWATATGGALRMSEDAAKSAALNFSSFGLAMGQSGQELATYSTGLSELAGDLAAYGDYDLTTVVNDMSSALSGGGETLRKYGVLINENSLRQLAFEQGITESNRMLTQQERVLATTAAMYDQLGYAVGASERAQGSFGDSMRTLQANFANVRAELGSKFIPIATTLVDLLAGPGLSALSGFGDALGVVAKGVEILGSVFGSLPGPIQAAIASVVAFRLANRVLGDRMTNLGGNIRTGVTSLGAYGSAVRQSAQWTKQANPGMSALGRSMIVLGAQGGKMGALGQSFQRASGAGQSFTGTMRGMGNVAVTAGRQLGSGLMGALGGPWGVALAGATIALGYFMGQVQESKARQEESAAATREWADAFEQSNGVIDESINAMARKKVADLDSADTLNEYGYSVSDVTAALITQGDALDQILDKMRDVKNDSMSGSLLSDMARGKGEIVSATTEAIDGLEKLRDEYNTGRDMAGVLTEAQNRQAAATRDQGDAADQTSPAMQSVNDAMAAMSDTASTGADKVKALSDALGVLRGEELTVEEATLKVNDALRGLDFSEMEAGLYATNGVIDTTTEAGSKLYNEVTGLVEATDGLASAQMEMALRNGQSLPEALGAAELAVRDNRDAFIEAAVAAGMNADAAKEVADHYGLIPEDVRTHLEVSGAEAADGLIKSIGDQTARLTGEPHTFRVDALTDTAQTRLRELGFGVEEIDGEFEVVALNAQAMAALADVHGEVDGLDKDVNVDVRANTEQLVIALNDVGIQVRGLPPGQVRLYDNTPEVRKKLDDIKVGYAIIDGHVAVTDNTPEVHEALHGVSTHTRELPPGHIEITDTSPENIARLEAVGVTTTTLPDGRVIITDNSVETASKIDSNLNGKTTSGTHNILTNIIESVRRVFNADGNYFPGTAFSDGGTAGRPIAVSDLPAKATPPQVEDRRAQIAPAGAWRVWAEEETGGEAYIPLSQAKRRRSTAILSQVAEKFGYFLAGAPSGMSAMGATGLLPGAPVSAFDEGGFHNFSASKGLTGTPYIWGGFSPAGVDCSGLVSVAANEATGRDAYSERATTHTMGPFLAARGFKDGPGKSGDLRIGWNGTHTSGTSPDGTAFESQTYGRGSVWGGDSRGHDNPEFTEHMHLPMGDPGDELGAPKSDNRTQREKNIDAIVEEGQRRGLSDRDIQIALMTAEQESGTRVLANPADPASMGMANEGTGYDHDSTGIFQQRNNGAWGTLEDRMDPTKSSGMFYDQLEKLQGRENMRLTEVAQKVQGSAYPEAYAQHEGNAASMLAASKSRIESMGTSAGGADGQGQRVYVTNWPSGGYTGGGGSSSGASSGGDPGDTSEAEPWVRPDSLAAMAFEAAGIDPNAQLDAAEGTRDAVESIDGKTDQQVMTPNGPAHLLASALGVQAFADGGIRSGFGGIENHTAQITPAGSWRVWGEPETGGEAYIPLAPSKRAKSQEVLLETAKRIGLTGLGVLGAGASFLTNLAGGGLGASTDGSGIGLDDFGIDGAGLTAHLSRDVDAQASILGQQVAEAAAQFLGRAYQNVDAAVGQATAGNDMAGQIAREQIARAML